MENLLKSHYALPRWKTALLLASPALTMLFPRPLKSSCLVGGGNQAQVELAAGRHCRAGAQWHD